MKSLNFKVPDSEAKRLKDIAKSRHKTMTELLRTWIANLKEAK